ncbi:MAG TPA: hypothetical protein VN999_11825 [Thermoanaerobaculia bacterium]|nr:hypothetical protein [Thermoanaerobaculia bacterium]
MPRTALLQSRVDSVTAQVRVHAERAHTTTSEWIASVVRRELARTGAADALALRSCVPLPAAAGESGTFWFFAPNEVELAVKILDGRPSMAASGSSTAPSPTCSTTSSSPTPRPAG